MMENISMNFSQLLRPNLQAFHRRHLLQFSLALPFASVTPKAFSSASEPPKAFGTAKRCILLWLDGGPSHLEMWDPKQDVPIEVRGPFASIPTSVPGTHFSEHLERCAKIADRMTIIRSMTSPLGEHGLANQYALTGYLPSPNLIYPSLGSIAAYQSQVSSQNRNQSQTNAPTVLPQSRLPSYIGIPEPRTGLGAGFLGSNSEPFWIGSDPAQPSFQIRDLSPPSDFARNRITRRRKMLEELRKFDHSDNTSLNAAFELVEDIQAKQAFELQLETQKTRERYGPRTFGQSCLLARRLIEHDVRFVSVIQPGWDTHENLSVSLRDGYSGAKVGVGLIPTFDQATSALIEDLQERGLLEETLVIAMGEFGRTPKLNTRGGRDHWPRVYSVMLCGGGLPQGLVFGQSDRIGEQPSSNPVTPADLIHTLLIRLGIDPASVLSTPDARPIPINQHGKPIDALLT